MKRNEIKRPKRRGIFLRRGRAAHDRWLVMGIALFNFAGGWNHLLARRQAQQLNT